MRFRGRVEFGFLVWIRKRSRLSVCSCIFSRSTRVSWRMLKKKGVKKNKHNKYLACETPTNSGWTERVCCIWSGCFYSTLTFFIGYDVVKTTEETMKAKPRSRVLCSRLLCYKYAVAALLPPYFPLISSLFPLSSTAARGLNSGGRRFVSCPFPQVQMGDLQAKVDRGIVFVVLILYSQVSLCSHVRQRSTVAGIRCFQSIISSLAVSLISLRLALRVGWTSPLLATSGVNGTTNASRKMEPESRSWCMALEMMNASTLSPLVKT